MTTEERNRAIRNAIDEVRARLRSEDTDISSRENTNYVGADISAEAATDFAEALDEDNDIRITDSIRVEPSTADIAVDQFNSTVETSGLWRFNTNKSYIRPLTPLDSKPLMLDLIKRAIKKGLITSKDILMLFKEVNDGNK